MTIEFRPLARLQFLEMVDDYAILSPKTASRFQTAFAKALRRIEFLPLSWTKITRKSRLYILRRFHVGIFFRIDAKRIRVTGVIDLRTNWRSLRRWWEE